MSESFDVIEIDQSGPQRLSTRPRPPDFVGRFLETVVWFAFVGSSASLVLTPLGQAVQEGKIDPLPVWMPIVAAVTASALYLGRRLARIRQA